jgi:hypothetical protein
MKEYLVAHTDDGGKNVAQATILADSEAKAKEKFRKLYPGRTLQTVGVRGRS